MNKRIYFVIWVCVALVPGVSAQAAARENSQQGSSERQASRQQVSRQQEMGSNKQSTTRQKADDSDNASAQSRRTLISEAFIAHAPSELLASSIIGMSIENKAGTIGTVSDLIMNKQYQLVGVVADMTGMLIGKSVGFSWNAVRSVNPEKGILWVKVSQQQLLDAPSYTTK